MNKRIQSLCVLPVSLLLQAILASTAFAETAVATNNIFSIDAGGSAVATEAANNSGYGAAALAALTTGDRNSAFGASALVSTTIGSYNNAFGVNALTDNVSGESNNAFGDEVLTFSTGSFNSGFGDQALKQNTTGKDNVAVGVRALAANTTAAENVAVGVVSLLKNTVGFRNTAAGHAALSDNRSGDYNLGLGYLAGSFITTGNNNIAVGSKAGTKITTGSNNIEIGNVGAAGDTAVIRLGRQGTQKKTFIAGIRGTTVSGATVVASASGQLGVQSSSRRYKQDIADMGVASDALLKLRPVTFHYKQADEAGERPLQYGLIAEEVAQVMPALVVRDEDGQPETVAYQTLSSLLLNEYQQQHRDMRALAAAARDQQHAAQERLVRLERKLESRDRELVALHEELARLSQLTRQLQAALPAAQPLAVREP